MKIRPLTVALLLLSAALGSPTQACLWDSDTLQTEARGLPDVVEVIIALAGQHGCDDQALMALVSRKRAARGGFSEGFFDATDR